MPSLFCLALSARLVCLDFKVNQKICDALSFSNCENYSNNIWLISKCSGSKFCLDLQFLIILMKLTFADCASLN